MHYHQEGRTWNNKRIDDLRSDLEAAHDERETTLSFDYALQDVANFPGMEDEHAELLALESLADEAAGYADDWRHGATLIRDSYFKTYAQELAEDIGAINRESTWPNNCIDWDQAATELQMDYTQVDFDGVAYWIR